MRAINTMPPYWGFLILNFYLLPFFMAKTGLAMILLMVVMPLISFLCAVLYGIRHAFHPLFAFSAVVLLVPSLYFFYNNTAWIYILSYALVVLAGNLVGTLFSRVAH